MTALCSLSSLLFSQHGTQHITGAVFRYHHRQCLASHSLEAIATAHMRSGQGQGSKRQKVEGCSECMQTRSI